MSIPDRLLARALEQRGLIVRAQAHEFGLSDNQLRHLVDTAGWRSPHRSVYVLPGARFDAHAKALAAVLSTSPPAAASHRTALALWGAPVSFPSSPDVLTREGRPQRDRWFDPHRTRLWRSAHITELDGIPVTTPVRALIDSSLELSRDELGRCIDELIRRRVMTIGELGAAIERFGTGRGRALHRLGEAVALRSNENAQFESKLELNIANVLRKAGLGHFVTQCPVTIFDMRFRIDMAFLEEMVAVEADGYGFHSARNAFDYDRERQNALMAYGFLVLRFTSTSSPDRIVQAVRTALELRQGLRSQTPA